MPVSLLACLPRPRPRARHDPPRAAASALVAGGVTAALIAVPGAALAAAPPTDETFERLAQCESSGNWSINTGNGYYGGLQFSLTTWRWIGYTGYPHEASKSTQIEAGRELQARLGWGQWPACSRKLGLESEDGGAPPAPPPPTPEPTPPPPPPQASRDRPTPPPGVPAFEGTVTVADVGTVRADVRAWQARMRKRGWLITVDGRFGPQSASVAQRFAAQKGLPLAAGSLDARVFSAAWTMPVT